MKARSDLVEDITLRTSNSFSAKVMGTPFSERFKMSIIPHYDRTTDQSEHLGKFTLSMWAPTNKLCRVLNLTLTGNVERWFERLPDQSVSSCNDLRRPFLTNFAGVKDPTKNKAHCLFRWSSARARHWGSGSTALTRLKTQTWITMATTRSWQLAGVFSPCPDLPISSKRGHLRHLLSSWLESRATLMLKNPASSSL